MDKLTERKVSTDDRDDDIIELGVASVETKGGNPITNHDSPAAGGLFDGMLIEE
ncbi:benenodin family lasso peptide [Sphingobium sp.]|uniref:benenodin family lasso peptide n=1 Tax=Sphingobium sp. TaxID=1912891 RepID=UPI002579501A|nr:benenodin family lasso peptide [Sphingobium sp.]